MRTFGESQGHLWTFMGLIFELNHIIDREDQGISELAEVSEKGIVQIQKVFNLINIIFVELIVPIQIIEKLFLLPLPFFRLITQPWKRIDKLIHYFYVLIEHVPVFISFRYDQLRKLFFAQVLFEFVAEIMACLIDFEKVFVTFDVLEHESQHLN